MIRLAVLLAIALTTPATLVDDDVLEPSVQNEVDHALAIAPTNAVSVADYPETLRLFCATNDFFGTNGLTRTDCAIRILSAQRADGRWLCGTNDVTSVAVDLLERFSR